MPRRYVRWQAWIGLARPAPRVCARPWWQLWRRRRARTWRTTSNATWRCRRYPPVGRRPIRLSPSAASSGARPCRCRCRQQRRQRRTAALAWTLQLRLRLVVEARCQWAGRRRCGALPSPQLKLRASHSVVFAQGRAGVLLEQHHRSDERHAAAVGRPRTDRPRRRAAADHLEPDGRVRRVARH